MFAIIITEKGGTERREVYDKTEINVGRVQGNELMLPKGNVSKHHARLLYRDGRFIVTDLKSTNGTYVNGRKITQATIVREGDKIYVGDFILRLEMPQQAQLPPPQQAEAAPISQPPRGDLSGADRLSSSSGQGPVSHYPLENDPDENSAAISPAPAAAPPPPLRMPAPPRLPTTQTRDYASSPSAPSRPSPVAGFAPGAPPGDTGGMVAPAGSAPIAPPVAPPAAPPAAQPIAPPLPPLPGGATATSPSGVSSGSIRKPAVPSARPPVGSSPRIATPAPFAQPEVLRVPAHRQAVISLVSHVEEMLDLSSLEYGAPPQEPLASRLDRAIREEAPKLKAAGEVPAEVDVDALARDVREEFVGLGPLEPLMRDDDVVEIHIQSCQTVFSTRTSAGRRAELPFASESACRRIIRRLCWQGGVALQGDEPMIERMLYGGVQIVAVFDPIATTGVTASIRKRGQVAQSLEDQVRNGVLSRAMATFLGQVVTSRRNILVAGPTGSGVGAFVAALGSSSLPGERTVVVQELGSSVPQTSNATALVIPSHERAREVTTAACRLRPDRLIAPSLGADTVSLLLEAIAGGTEGVVLGVRSPTLRQALGRIAGLAAAERGSSGIDSACELVATSFDLLVEFARLRDGRCRVMRIAEPAAVESGTVTVRDLFVFSVERTASGGAIEGAFHPAGVIPRVAEELTSRGVSIEPGLFRR
ncbi:MAG: Flp pilus assembly complex ATPase component TadA [Deltaproteobacteria bacterium]|nr:Flp pilus assembly complex ATPase component TadA [Deltaproteobacteria bacterium]